MNHEPLGERLTRIEDEIALVDSALDARTRELWTALNTVMAALDELRNKVNAPVRTRARMTVAS